MDHQEHRGFAFIKRKEGDWKIVFPSGHTFFRKFDDADEVIDFIDDIVDSILDADLDD